MNGILSKPVGFEMSKLLHSHGYEFQPTSLGKEYSNRFYETLRKTELERTDFALIQSPSISDAIDWIYKEHGIWIVVSYEVDDKTFQKEWFWVAIRDGEEIAYQYAGFILPCEAYEAAIKHTLENQL